MKKISLIMMLFASTCMAQIKGNGSLTDRTFTLAKIETLEINLTANIIIDINGKNQITVKTDSNLHDYITKDVKNSRLDLSQLEWINPSKRPEILIELSSLDQLINDAHSRIDFVHIDQNILVVNANVGELVLSGKVNNLKLKVATARVNAKGLVAENADIAITSWGKVEANVLNDLNKSLSDQGQLRLVNNSDQEYRILEKSYDESIRYINLKITNNSWNRNKFIVVGPKPDGTSFSYGFYLWPGQTKKERWTVGTQVFKVSLLGKRKLVAELELDDANSLVKLF